MTDLLLRNGRLPGSDAAVDLTVQDGRVVDIRPHAARSPVTPGATEKLDLEGRFLLPGLWDEHVHVVQEALASRRLDVSGAGSARAAADMVRRACVTSPPPDGLPLIGYGFRDALWADEPSTSLLDEATGNLPVVLLSADLHCVWLNSAAAARYGAASGPDGILREDAAFDVSRRLGQVPLGILDGWVRDSGRAAAARGVVGIVDLEMAWNRDDWLRRIATGATSLRVEFGIYRDSLSRAIEEGMRSGTPVDGGAGLLTVGYFKLLIDGSLNTRTAYCFDRFPGMHGPAAYGLLTVPPSELKALLSEAVSAGLTPTVHAIGDHANSLALDAFEELGAPGRIEHAQLVSAADLPRFGALGVTASVQPEHAMDDRDVADEHWHGRTARAFPLRSLLDAGATLAFGSDAPVAPSDPWVTLAAAVARSRDGRTAWHPEQAITVSEALQASSRGRSEVSVRDVADLIAVDRDPLRCTAEELRTMPVALTLLGGRPTHQTL